MYLKNLFAYQCNKNNLIKGPHKATEQKNKDVCVPCYFSGTD